MAPPRKRLEVVPHAVHGDTRLVRYRRSPTDPRWEVEVRLPPPIGRKQVMLGTDDLAVAQVKAAEVRGSLLAQAKAGIKVTGRAKVQPIRPDLPAHPAVLSASPGSPTFRDAASIALADLRGDMATEVRKFPDHADARTQKFRQLIDRIERILLPRFGDQALLAMRPSDINDFKREYRTVKGKKPAKNTIGNIAHALGKVMTVAVEKNWIAADHPLRLSHKNIPKGDRRPTFTDAEFRKLLAASDDGWVEEGGKRVIRESRLLLWSYIRIVACSGIRPGVEMETLKQGSISREETPEGRSYGIVKVVHGKTGKHREAIIRNIPGCDWLNTLGMLFQMQDMRVVGRPAARREYLFARPIDGVIPGFERVFRQLLDHADLRMDPATGQPRTLYSLRHYYATHSLRAGVPDHWLAKQMGTSIQMIHEHYSHATTRDVVHLLAGPEIIDRLPAE